MSNRGTMVNGKVGFNHAGYQKAVAELPVTLMDRRARLEHEFNLTYRGIKSPVDAEPKTVEEANDYWMLQEMAGLVTRWVKVDNVLIWPKESKVAVILTDEDGNPIKDEEGNVVKDYVLWPDGYFVSYFNTASNRQKLVTTSKTWGEALAKDIKEYNEYWKDTYLEPYHYYHILTMINFYCEDATPKKQTPKDNSFDALEYKSSRYQLELMQENEKEISYEKHNYEPGSDLIVNPEVKSVAIGVHLIANTDKTIEYERYMKNEDGTETILNHNVIIKDPVPEWKQKYYKKYEKQGIPSALWDALAEDED